MQDALEQLAELIKLANVNNKSPGSWVTIQPDGTATYAGEKFATIALMLDAVEEMATRPGEPKRFHRSAFGVPEEEMADCCALPGSTRIECQRESGRTWQCRCPCHDHMKPLRYQKGDE
jgi:hypothetical protein